MGKWGPNPAVVERHHAVKIARLLAMAALQVPDACQLWPDRIDPKGYGRIHFYGMSRLAHDVIWEVMNGRLDDDLTLDHFLINGGGERCSKACVNLFHLEPVSNVVNVMRGNGACARHARQTHCKRGHEFTAENTIRRDDGGRECLACRVKRADDGIQQRKLERGYSYSERWKHVTHCRHGHEFTIENTLFKNSGRERRCRECYLKACREGQRRYRVRQGERSL